MSDEDQRPNPMIQLINTAETEEYRHEVAMTAAIYYHQRLGAEHPGVGEISRVALMTKLTKEHDSLRHAQHQWEQDRKKLTLWKRLRTPHVMSEKYLEEWVENERMRAFMDVSSIIALRGDEL